MAIFATLAGALGRFAGKVLNAILGWASTLLFGRVPKEKQILLLLVTFGAILWVVLVVGVIVPDVGTFLLAAVPVPDFVDENWVRLAMLAAAILLPALIGAATVFIPPPERRAKGVEIVKSVLRGYPLAFVLAFVLVFLGFVAVARKARALFKRWKDAHVPIVVREGGYDRLVDDMERALDDAGLAVTPELAPSVLSVPAKVMAAVAGSGIRSLVPDRLVQFTGDGLEVQLYPSDVAIAGSDHNVLRARAALASRLASSAAFLTTTAEAQKLEERIQRVAERRRLDARADADLRRVDEELSTLDADYEEWEVLYRERLQVERDLVTGRTPGAGPEEAPGTGRDARPATGASLGLGDPRVGGIVAALSIGLLALDVLLAVRDRGRL